MHRFNVSAEVFSRLWALRQDAEQTEDQILRRLLDCPPEAADGGALADGSAPVSVRAPDNVSGGDFIDATYGVRFAEGDEIFRTYKGRPYAARVVHGRWLLDGDARPYDSLNQLSQAVIDGNENAWMFWFTRRPDGTGKRIAELRDPALVQKRPRRKRRRGWVAEPEATTPAGAPKDFPSPAALATPLATPLTTPSVSQAAFQAAPSRSAPGERPETPGGGKAWEPAPKPERG